MARYLVSFLILFLLYPAAAGAQTIIDGLMQIECVRGCAAAPGGGATTDIVAIDGVPIVGGNLPVTVTNFPVGGTGLTDTELRASAVPVSFTTPISVTQSGTWSVTQSGAWTVGVNNFPASFSISNFPVTQAVTGTFFQATQPVSGTFWQALQDISINQTGNNNAVDVLTLPAITIGNTSFDVGNFPAGFNVNNFPASQAVTNTGTFAVQCTTGCAAGSPGQQTMANSSPVVIASNQSSIPVTIATLPSLATGANAIGSITNTAFDVGNFPSVQDVECVAGCGSPASSSLISLHVLH